MKTYETMGLLWPETVRTIGSKKTGKSFKEVVNEILRTGLLTQEALTQPEIAQFEVKARALGMKPGFSYDNVAGLLEQAEGPQYK